MAMSRRRDEVFGRIGLYGCLCESAVNIIIKEMCTVSLNLLFLGVFILTEVSWVLVIQSIAVLRLSSPIPTPSPVPLCIAKICISSILTKCGQALRTLNISFYAAA